MKSVVPYCGGKSALSAREIFGRGPMIGLMRGPFPFGPAALMIEVGDDPRPGGIDGATMLAISRDCSKVKFERAEGGEIRVTGGPSWIASSADMVGMAATDVLGIPADQPTVEGQVERAILEAVVDLVGAGALRPYRDAPPDGVHLVKGIAGGGTAYVDLDLGGGASFRGLVSVDCRGIKPGDYVKALNGELVLNVSRSCGAGFARGFCDGFLQGVRESDAGKPGSGRIHVDSDCGCGDGTISLTISIDASKAGSFRKAAQAALTAEAGKPIVVKTMISGEEGTIGPCDVPAVDAGSNADLFMETGAAAGKAAAASFVEKAKA